MKLKLPQRLRSADLEAESVRALDNTLPANLFLIRRKERDDYGVDMVLEARNGKHLTNINAQVQLKATDSNITLDNDPVPFRIDVRNLNYVSINKTGLYILYLAKARQFRYAWAQDEVGRLTVQRPRWQEQDSVTLHFTRVLTSATASDIHKRMIGDAGQQIRINTPIASIASIGPTEQIPSNTLVHLNEKRSNSVIDSMAQEEDAIIRQYFGQTAPFYASFYSNGNWKPNRFVTRLAPAQRTRFAKNVSEKLKPQGRFAPIRRSVLLLKALDQNGHPCLLLYFSGRITDGWQTWLLPSIDRDSDFSGGEYLNLLTLHFESFLGLPTGGLGLRDLGVLSICVKSNRFSYEPGDQLDPDFYAIRYYAGLVRDKGQLLARSSVIHLGSTSRELRWLYVNELDTAHELRMGKANYDVIKTIYDVWTLHLTQIPDSFSGACIRE